MKCLCCRDINNVEYAPKGDAVEISEFKCSRNMGGEGRKSSTVQGLRQERTTPPSHVMSVI